MPISDARTAAELAASLAAQGAAQLPAELSTQHVQRLAVQLHSWLQRRFARHIHEKTVILVKHDYLLVGNYVRVRKPAIHRDAAHLPS